ncbi:MAG: NRDE family protein [Candidatus Hydrogenedentota bacterium]
MCTLTVYKSTDRLLATMNRDEALTRAPESPPKIHDIPGGGQWIAPHDSAKGGTWMGANSYGAIACLLNAYLPGDSLLPDTTGRYKSRGEIIPAVLESGNVDAAIAYIENSLDPENYPSFNLLIFGPGIGRCITWLRQGELVWQDVDEAWTLRSSSGWDSREVKAWREEIFSEWIASGEEMVDHLPKFHLYQESGREDWSPLMKRPWAATRSVTQVEVDLVIGETTLRYWPQPHPDSQHPETVDTIPCVSASMPPADLEV